MRHFALAVTVADSAIATSLRIAGVPKDALVDLYDFQGPGTKGGPWVDQIGFTVRGAELTCDEGVAGEMSPTEIGPRKYKTVSGLKAYAILPLANSRRS